MKMEKRRKEWILIFIATWLGFCNAQSDWNWDWDTHGSSQTGGSFPMRSDMACEGFTMALRCPGADVIQIETAEYGRKSTETCSALPNKVKNTNCALPQAFDIMSEKCNNKTQCSLTVSTENLPDPCPETHKYLRVIFNCVKFMFGCPGSLIGIGTEDVTSVEFQPQPGAWVKDPLYETDHVFFAPFNSRLSQSVHEYLKWEDFISGTYTMTYNLPSNIADGNFVVYDRNLYYVKANSRSVIKYSLITRYRTKETVIPGPKTVRNGLVGKDITLASDESGLWVIYTSDKGRGFMAIGKLDKEDLSLVNTWTTSYSHRAARHIFVICGVVYTVSSTTGTVEYSYNTNVAKNNEKRGLHLAFDADRSQAFAYTRTRGSSPQSRRKYNTRSFLRYNATSLSYNPRDRLLYLWDNTGGNAVYYKLHFDARDPKKPDVTTTSTTTTTRRTTLRTTRLSTTEKPPPRTIHFIPPIINVGVDFCPNTIRGDITWPETKAGDIATMACPDSSGAVATWSCVRDSSMREAAWHVAGPDLSKCITWASNIENNFARGFIDRAQASENLASDMDLGPLSDKAIEIAAGLVKKLAEDPPFPSKYEAERIVKSLTTVSSNLLREENEPGWGSMSDTLRPQIANSLMTSIEKAGFLYADTVAATPANARSDEPLVVASDDILVQVEVRDRDGFVTSSSATSFPSEKTCAENAQWTDVRDSIEISDQAIMAQKGEGPATVVFALYSNLGEFLSPPSTVEPQSSSSGIDDAPAPTEDWEVDTRVISASFRDTTYKAKLSTPAVIMLEHKQPSTLPRRCVYWDYSESTKSGNWSDMGCRKIDGNSTHTKCECDHLTSFTVLVNHAGVSARVIEPVLDIVTSVGISISIVCLVICIFTFSCFRNLRSDRNTIHKHLCICLLVAESIFLFGINQTQYKVACSVIAGLLHYSFLAAFIWMALEGFQLYVMLVEVFEGNSRWKWYYLAGYGIPAVIVGVSAAVDYTGYGTDDVCWLRVDSGFIWSFVGPVCVVILANLVFLSITVYKMYVHTMTFTDSSKINSIKASVRGASVLLCLLGITWAFGILWVSEQMTVLAYLFCIFNAFQGLFIFIFHCLLPRKVRQEYNRCFSRLPCCQNLSRDTYVSNSMSFSKQYTPGRFANGTSGGANQSSLSRQSQLRRMWNETVLPKNPDSAPIASEVPNRDSSRPGSCSHRLTPHQATPNEQTGQHDQAPSLPTRQQPIRQEDDVFLPPDPPVPEPRQQNPLPETLALLPNAQDEIQYDHLQHHHHYHQGPPFRQEPYPHAHYPHTHGKLPPVPRPMHSSTVAHSHSGHMHAHPGHFSSTSYSQSRIHDMLDDPNMPRYPEGRFEGGHGQPQYWSDAPSGHQYQSSYEDNLNPAKRDSGIGMQHPAQNSMIQQLTNEMHRNKIRRSQENLSDGVPPEGGYPAAPRRYSQPLRAQDSAEEGYERRNPRHNNQFIENGRQSSFEEQDKDRPRSHTLAPRMGPPCPHTQMMAPVNERTGKAVTLAGGNRRRKSMSSDSDDPIVTDCSVSSTGSSFGNPLTSLTRTRQDNITEEPYFEEKYHKRRLPDPAQCVESHREAWYPRKSDSKEGKETHDENDLEVEMITAPEHGGDHRGPPSLGSYHNQHGSASPTSCNSPEDGAPRDERYIAPPAGYRSVGGKIYPAGAAHVPYYGNRNSGNGGSPSPQDFNKPGYRYAPRDTMGDDPDSGLRMMTNL